MPLKFDSLQEAIAYALQNHYNQEFEFCIDDRIHKVERVNRLWACEMMPGMFYDLFDEEMED